MPQDKPKKISRPDTPLAPTPVVRYENSIKNPANKEFVAEVAFNKSSKGKVTNKGMRKVTQDEFNDRYGVSKDSTAYLPVKKK